LVRRREPAEEREAPLDDRAPRVRERRRAQPAAPPLTQPEQARLRVRRSSWAQDPRPVTPPQPHAACATPPETKQPTDPTGWVGWSRTTLSRRADADFSGSRRPRRGRASLLGDRAQHQRVEEQHPGLVLGVPVDLLLRAAERESRVLPDLD